MGAKNFNLAPKFYQNQNFQSHILHFLKKHVQQFLDCSKFRERGNCFTAPLRRDATGRYGYYRQP